jgi:hypothetical protein
MRRIDMKKLALLAAVAAGLMATSTAAAQDGLGGVGAGGVAACADANELATGELAPVPQLMAYPGPPGPFAGPNSRIDYAAGKNNGTDLVLFCQAETG